MIWRSRKLAGSAQGGCSLGKALPGATATNNRVDLRRAGTIDIVWSNTPSNPATYSQATGVHERSNHDA